MLVVGLVNCSKDNAISHFDWQETYILRIDYH